MPGGSTNWFTDTELGNAVDNARAAKFERHQLPVREAAASLRLAYYDQARDYLEGEARASAGEQDGREERTELPAVLDANGAKTLVEDAIARRWAKRDKLTLRLSPTHLDLEPGTKVEIPLCPTQWIVENCTIDSFVVVAELRPSSVRGVAVTADSGRIVGNPDVVVGETVLALFDTPGALSLPNAPSVLMAASTPTRGWKSRTVEISVGTQRQILRTASRKARLGRALSVLPPSDDPDASIDVELVDSGQWLVSEDDDALAWGANTAIVGREVLQFGDALPIGPGQFRLSRLLRGRDRTESAMAGHSADEWFVLVEADALRVIELPSYSIGSQVSAKAIGIGSEGPEAQATVGWGGLRPLSGSALLLDGMQVVGTRGSAIASPMGGTTVDLEARSTIEQLLSALRQHGLIEM